MSNKRKTTMSQDEKSLRHAIEKLEATETAVQREISAVIGTPDKRQKELLENLSRLQHSLRGPEELLDRRSYSRPFPPLPSRQHKEKTAGG
jgi:hypothetical protein